MRKLRLGNLCRKAQPQGNVLRRNYGKSLGIDRENRCFYIEVSVTNLRHTQLFIKDEFLELKDGNFFANLQTISDLFYCYQTSKLLVQRK